MIASDWVSTSPESSRSAGTRMCGLMARYSGLRLMPALLLQVDRHGVVGDALEVERDADPVGRRRAEIRIELHLRPFG